MQQAHQNHSPQVFQKSPSFTIYKLHGANQYVLYTGGQEVNFLLEEDARRFAHRICGLSDLSLPVCEIECP